MADKDDNLRCGPIPESDRVRLAEVIENGFAQNLAPIIPYRSKRLRVLAAGVNLHAVIGAYVEGELRGVVGLNRAGASVFDRMTFSLLRQELGAGAIKARLALRLVDRPLEPGTMRVEFLAVEDTARGRGVGRALLRSAECDACAEHIPRMELHVEPDNEGARKLYLSEGFTEAPAPRESALRRWLVGETDIRMTKESQCTTC
jgi:ribosomal protein S18 acetylase RimI-like enzyme